MSCMNKSLFPLLCVRVCLCVWACRRVQHRIRQHDESNQHQTLFCAASHRRLRCLRQRRVLRYVLPALRHTYILQYISILLHVRRRAAYCARHAILQENRYGKMAPVKTFGEHESVAHLATLYHILKFNLVENTFVTKAIRSEVQCESAKLTPRMHLISNDSSGGQHLCDMFVRRCDNAWTPIPPDR